jgi:hypothetical protein
VIDQDLSDATDLSHHSIKGSGKEEMPESFGYLSEGDPNFQGSLESVTKKQLSGSHSTLKDGSGEESANDHKVSGDSKTPQEGRTSEPFGDESHYAVARRQSFTDFYTTAGRGYTWRTINKGHSLFKNNVRAEERSTKRGGSRWEEV